MTSLGRAVRELRTARGLTQEALAEAAGLHPRYISDIERGRRNVGIVNLAKLAAALDTDLVGLATTVEVSRAG
jgi:transcriptional regulator with XRE-family HTH domain